MRRSQHAHREGFRREGQGQDNTGQGQRKQGSRPIEAATGNQTARPARPMGSKQQLLPNLHHQCRYTGELWLHVIVITVLTGLPANVRHLLGVS